MVRLGGDLISVCLTLRDNAGQFSSAEHHLEVLALPRVRDIQNAGGALAMHAVVESGQVRSSVEEAAA